MLKYTAPMEYKKYIKALENIYKKKYTRGSKRSRANIIITAILMVVNPLSKLPKNIPIITPELFKRAQIESLKSNLLYLVFFQKIALVKKT